jgi:hypothetical protein
LRSSSGSGRRSSPSAISKSIHVGRTAASDQQILEQRPPGIVEHHELAVEHAALRQQIERALVPLQPIAGARNQPTANGVGRSPKTVELQLEQPVAMVKRFRPGDWIISVSMTDSIVGTEQSGKYGS